MAIESILRFYLVAILGVIHKYVRKFFRKTNISNPYVRVRIRGLEMLVFRKILLTYLMDGSVPVSVSPLNLEGATVSASRLG